MRTSGLFNILFLTSAFFVLGGFAVQAHARDAAKEQELLRTIELQQGQLEAQQKQLDAQRKMLEEIQSQTQKLLENAQQVCRADELDQRRIRKTIDDWNQELIQVASREIQR